MTPLHSSGLSLPRAGRPHDTDSMQPKTPEPCMGDDGMQRPPSPPRPKFKLKRRVASNLNAPTQQFLASVAAADVPIPSIEEPPATFADDAPASNNDDNMACDLLQRPADLDFASVPRGRRLASPRTPAPGLAPSLSPRRYPDWTLGSLCSSVESTPECESSRPSTAVSTYTSASLFSRYSITSEDLRCLGPNMGEAKVYKSLQEGASISGPSCDSRRRRAKWTAPMTNHLWSTYCLYLRDPKVTPIRFSKSGIPPEGVCCRVAREAKRSWRGPNPPSKPPGGAHRSRNATPTGDAPTTFMQWPHTGGATRAHLRDLCKHMATSPTSRAGHPNAQTPTSFGRTVARLRRRRTTPMPSAFSSKEMSMSLALSTCESMQPSGPLARLTQATPEPIDRAAAVPTTPSAMLDAPVLENRRLASPFTAKSYGPSSSTELGAAFAVPLQRQPYTIGAQHALQSPARLTRSRSNTQKRRPRQSSAEPRRTKRPSLGSDLWVRPESPQVPNGGQLPDAETQAQFSSSTNTHEDVLCVPRTNLAELLSGPRRLTEQLRACGPGGQNPETSLDHPPRLGSPFASSTSSFSFPNRLFKREPLSAGATIRPFATIQRREDAVPVPSRDLDGRMTYLDQRLRELRQHTPLRRRSESPF